jgi:hypothetical protein
LHVRSNGMPTPSVPTPSVPTPSVPRTGCRGSRISGRAQAR